jgi:hypothetical protein
MPSAEEALRVALVDRRGRGPRPRDASHIARGRVPSSRPSLPSCAGRKAPPSPGPPCASAAGLARREEATCAAHRLALEVEALRAEGITTHQGLARALTERGVATPRGGATWTHTTVARVIERLGP